MDRTHIDNEELELYMEDRVLEAINKIPFEEQYFLIIVLFLKFVFCYGVENTTFVIIFILNFLKLNTSSESNYYYNFILDVLTWLNENLQLVVDKYINTRPDANEIERYKAFEDYFLLLEAKLYVLLANLTCCHGEMFGKQYLTKANTPIIEGTNVIVDYGDYKLKGIVNNVNGNGTYQISYNMNITVNPDIEKMKQVGQNVPNLEENVPEERVKLNKMYHLETTELFDEDKLIELLSPDIPDEIMNQLKEKYDCDTKEECMNKMIKDINSTPEVVRGLKKIVEKQNKETGGIAGQKVKIKNGVTTYLRNDTTPIDLSGRMVYVVNKSEDYDRIVKVDGEWYIGYQDEKYHIDPVTGQYRYPNLQQYVYYTGGNDPIRTIVFRDDEVSANVKPMNCYRVKIRESELPIVLPANAFDVNNIETYIENPEFKNAFEGIKQVIQNVFTNQDDSDKYLENYLNGVAEKEYRTKERFFEMVRYIFGTRQSQYNEIYPTNEEEDLQEDEETINPYALDIVAPVILEGCDVGIRYVRDSIIYFTGRMIDNTPAFRDWLLRNWNNMIDRLNELLRRINMRQNAETEIPDTENQVAIIQNNYVIPYVTEQDVDTISREPPTRHRAHSRTQGTRPNTPQFGERDAEEQEARRREARNFVDDMNERGAERDRQGVYNQQNTRPERNQLYNDLEILPNASQGDIKKAYFRLARQWHPDKNRDNEGEATAKFQKISLAYSVLSDPVKRNNYDTYGTIGGKTIKHRKGRRKGTKYIKTNKRYKKKIPRKTIKKHQKKSSRKRKTRRKN
jgi:hypothetical protein